VRFSKLVAAALLSGAAFSPVLAQDAPPPADDPATPAAPAEPEADTGVGPGDEPVEEELDGDEDVEEIVVTGSRPRGSVAGDIEPEIQLNRGEIRALGAGSIAELLDAISPQTQSGRGRGEGRPVLLMNGRRISGFSEIRDIPPEAITRVDILPEEVALKYGYRADQRVVNFVLRRRFRAVTAEAEAGLATEGGRTSYEADVNFLKIGRNGRFQADAEYERSGSLLESERDIVQSNPVAGLDIGEFRTLMPQTDRVAINSTVNRTILGNVSATLNGEFEASESAGLLGLRTGSTGAALGRETDTLRGHLGVALNGDLSRWRWSFTGNYDRTGTDTVTDRNLAAADRAETLSDSLDAQLVASGSLASLPAGEISTTFRAGFDARGLESEAVRGGVVTTRELSRERGSFQANVDLPIANRRREVLPFLGNLSLNANAEVEHFSDFGTLRTLGGGFNWEPIDEIRVLFSYTDEDGAPSMQQLGDPVLLTPGVRVFDFVRGETVDISRLEGGNPNLIADNRRVMKLGLTVRPLSEEDLTFTADYTSNRIDNPITSFPTATPEIEAAFPDRFVRDAGGRLVSIDARPLNFARSETRQLRWGLNYSKRLGPAPPPGGFRGRLGAGQGGRRGGQGTGGEGAAETRTAQPAPAQQGVQPGAEGRGDRARGEGGRGFGGGGGQGGRGFGGGGRGGFGGPPGAGRLQLGLFHTWRFEDSVLIRPGVPELDFLNGSAAGNRGGRPRHEIEAQAGLFKSGFGARATASWAEGTFVRGGPVAGGGTAQDLRFSDTMTVNLRLFADLGQQRSLVRANPWLRGTRIGLNIDNLFNSRPQVRDSTGATPLGYQPGYLDPLGRSVRLSIRKLFF
jgi:hypothetical protein